MVVLLAVLMLSVLPREVHASPTPLPFRVSRDDDSEQPKPVISKRTIPDNDANEDEDEGKPQPTNQIVVSAHALDAARTQIDAALGSSTYSLTNDTIENRPGGETGSLSSILAQAPGVSSTGNALIVRGAAANQIRVNNVIIPESISDPADHISSRFAQTTRLLTGTLPAQFGFAPAGVISVSTKNGLYQHGGEAEMFAGTDGSWEPALEWAGSFGRTSMFGSGNVEHGQTTVADASGLLARDSRNEVEGLGFADHVMGPDDRVSLLLGGNDERHNIGATSQRAGTEHSSDEYAVGTYQHTTGGFTLQASFHGGAASNEAAFAASTYERRSTIGVQVDVSAEAGSANTMKLGLLGDRSTVREFDVDGSRERAGRTTLALYLQDEWEVTSRLTFNPGVRAEWLRGLERSATFEPRASLVWQTNSGFSAHAGYSRFAAAPPMGEEQPGMPLADEHDDYVDGGVQQRVGPITLGADVYTRWADNYLAEHATIGTATRIAFAFREAEFRGIELSATYARHGTNAWVNLALSSAKGKTIVGGAGLFAEPTLKAVDGQFVPLASERPFTLSMGLGQRLGSLNVSGDLQVSSGAVETTNSTAPNGRRRSAFALLGVAGVYHAHIFGPRTDLRIDATNLTNSHVVSTDASALEGGWTRRAVGRAVALGIEQAF